MKKGLVAALLFVSPLYGDSHSDFLHELQSLRNNTPIEHKKNCATHMTVKQVIDYDVKAYYGSGWPRELDRLNERIQDDYANNFGICIDFIAIEEWGHEPTLTIEVLMQEQFFVEPQGANVVLGMTGMRNYLTPVVGRTEMLGTYSVIKVDRKDGELTYLHEIAHLFGAEHSKDRMSIMYAKDAQGLLWDNETRKTVLANKSRGWELDETKRGLHTLTAKMDVPSLKKMKRVYRLFGLAAIASDKQAVWDNATALTKELNSAYPLEGHLDFILAELALKQEKEEEAMRLYEVAIRKGNAYAVVQNNLAYYYLEKGEKKKSALELAEAAVSKKENDEFLDTLGWAYYHNEQYAKAEQTLLRTKKLEKVGEYQYHLGMTYDKLHKINKAKDALQKAIRYDRGEYRERARKQLKKYNS